MNKSKDTKSDILLESLNKNELKSFDRFLVYRLKGKSGDILRFWKLKYSPETGCLNSVKKGLVTRKTLSDFNKKLEKFLIIKNLENDKLGIEVYLSRELRKRNVDKYFEKILKDIKNINNLNFQKGYQSTLTLLKLNFEEYLLYNSRCEEKNLYRTSKERVKLSEVVIANSKLFEYYNDHYFSSEGIYKDTGLIKIREIADYVLANSAYYKSNFPNVWTLYLIYIAIENSYSYAKIVNAFNYFIKNEKRYNAEFLQFGYDALTRLVFSNINSGNADVLKYFYNIMLFIYKKGMLKNVQHFQPRMLTAFVIVSLNNDNIKLAEKFVNEYQGKVVSSLREQVIKICQGMIELHKGNYTNVKNLLEIIKPHDYMLNIFCKTTLLKAYYLKKDFRNIYPVSDTLKHYINRRNDVVELKNGVLTFLNYLSKLAQVKKNNGRGLDYLETSLAKEKYFFQKTWILSEFNELKSGLS
jgi:hypothetical protein